MSKPKLPTHRADAWDCAFLTPPILARAVACQRGRLVAGGEQIFRLKPGEEQLACRNRPEGTGPVLAVAAEGYGSGRIAIATETTGITIYNPITAEIVTLRGEPGASATHLAWGAPTERGPSLLNVRWNNGDLIRFQQGNEVEAYADFPPMLGVASDDNGVIALLSFEDPTPRVFVTRDGSEMSYRPATTAGEGNGQLFLAVADEAVAYSISGHGTYVSRSPGDAFARIAELEAGGPVAFEGTTSDAALFGVASTGTDRSVLRLDSYGKISCLAEFETNAEEPIHVTSLAWDVSRRTLWGTGPVLGLFKCVAPDGKKRRAN